MVQTCLGWHVGAFNGASVFYKEGGGGGFHCMMRLYPKSGFGMVVMTNATGCKVRSLLDAGAPTFLGSRSNAGTATALHKSGLRESRVEQTDDRKVQLAAGDTTVGSTPSTETRVELPRMAELYWHDPDKLNPADFARASMAIPLFFEPYIVRDVPRGEGQREKWIELAGFNERNTADDNWLPERCVLVDGGVMSNFPIDAFHDYNKIPRWPTFGIKLSWDNRNHYISKPSSVIRQVLNSARHTLDYEFIRRNVDYKHLVGFIDTGQYDWLDFSLDDHKKLDLFKRGAEAAVDFLDKFDWQHYKLVRAGLTQAHAPEAKHV